MLIKYCDICPGKPYTTDTSMDNCPNCGHSLRMKSVSDSELRGRNKLTARSRSTGSARENTTGRGRTSGSSTFSERRTHSAGRSAHRAGSSSGIGNKIGGFFSSLFAGRSHSGTVVRGTVSGYSCDKKEYGNYRRLFIQRVTDALFYRQRMEDVLHRFRVRAFNGSDELGNGNYNDVTVNVHGTIAGGANISEGSSVEVYGKYKNRTLMATRINVVDNGYKTPVTFQHSRKAVLYGILAIIIAGLLAYVGFNNKGQFFDNIGSFLKSWLIIFIILTVLYFVAIFSKIGIKTRLATGKARDFPLLGITLISLLINLIYVNSFGLGTSVMGFFSGLLSAVIHIVVVVGVIWLIFKLLFGRI